MSDGKTHSGVTIGITVGIATGYGCAYFLEPSQIAILGGGVLAGLLLSPDLDVDSGSIQLEWARRSGDRLWEWIWKTIWQPYSITIKHRSILSHGIIIGTMLRLIYIITPFWILLLGDQEFSKLSALAFAFRAQVMVLPLGIIFVGLLILWPWQTGLFCAGLLLSDIFHLIFDRI